MDIIIFAIIAGLIFYKLNKQLGKIDEEEKKNIEEKVSLVRRMQSEILKNQEKQDSSSQKLIGQSSTLQNNENIDDATKENLKNIFERCNISYEFFISGAQSAFEMIIKAFADGDVATLKMLLCEKIFNGFEKAINQRNIEQHKLITNLIAIDKVEIVSAITIENTASIVVKFISKQINYISDKEQKIVEGSKDQVSEITDIWTFKKDLNIANPNWAVSATHS